MPSCDRRSLLALALMAGSAASMPASAEPAAWRSHLYPPDWKPGFADGEGRFLHDFSYAGYRRGEFPCPPSPSGERLVVTQPPYGADPSGARDATEAIQRALDEAGRRGGGIVYLPAGTYRLHVPPGRREALRLAHDRVVLRGAGPGLTRLCNDTVAMRDKAVIRLAPAGPARRELGFPIRLSADLREPSSRIPLASVSGLSPGDWVMLESDATAAFIAEHDMGGRWREGMPGPRFLRRLQGVDLASGCVTIDIPTRYPLRTRDRARLQRLRPPLVEVGLADVSIGNREHPGSGWGDRDHARPGSAAHAVHGAHLIRLDQALDGWIDRVESYRPVGNHGDHHMLSNGILLWRSRSITLRRCRMQAPQYRGEGGNGYGFTLMGGENLLWGCVARGMRHNFDFKGMAASGNVLFRCSAIDGRLGSDFHMQLSMANLIDGMVLDGDSFRAVYRPWGGMTHGHTTTQSVFWNTRGLRYPTGSAAILASRQQGHGYVIGTSGPAPDVDVAIVGHEHPGAPEDWCEGIERGEALVPASLFIDQRRRRLGAARAEPR